MPDKALIVQNISRRRGCRWCGYRGCGGGGKGDGELAGGGGGNTLSCAGCCSGAAIDGCVGPVVIAGRGAADLGAAGFGLATILRGFGLTSLRGGGGSTCS